MPSQLFIPLLILVFSAPAAMACLLLWPIVPGRPVPDILAAELTADLIAIGLLALMLGIVPAMLLNAQVRR